MGDHKTIGTSTTSLYVRTSRQKEKTKPESYQTSLNPCSSPRKNSLRLLTLYKSKFMFIKLYSLRFWATNKFIIKFFALLLFLPLYP